MWIYKKWLTLDSVVGIYTGFFCLMLCCLFLCLAHQVFRNILTIGFLVHVVPGDGRGNLAASSSSNILIDFH